MKEPPDLAKALEIIAAIDILRSTTLEEFEFLLPHQAQTLEMIEMVTGTTAEQQAVINKRLLGAFAVTLAGLEMIRPIMRQDELGQSMILTGVFLEALEHSVRIDSALVISNFKHMLEKETLKPGLEEFIRTVERLKNLHDECGLSADVGNC